MSALALACCSLILYQVGCVCASFPDKFIQGHRLRAVFISISIALMATGAVALVLGADYGGLLLLVSVTLLLVFDHRAWSAKERIAHECMKHGGNCAYMREKNDGSL